MSAFCAVNFSENSSLPPLPSERSHDSDESIVEAIERRRISHSRGLEELRPMKLHVACNHNASGSAFVSSGKTKVMCSVFGPRSAGKRGYHDKAKISIDLKTTPFSVNPAKLGRRSLPESTLMMFLQQAVDGIVRLQLYPKTVIDICIIIIEDDGGVLPSAITCVSLALAQAGIELCDIVAGVSGCVFSRMTHDGQHVKTLVLDIDSEEERILDSANDLTHIHMGFCPSTSSVCFLHVVGPLISHNSGERLLELCEAACEVIGEEVRRTLKNDFAKKHTDC